MNTTIIIIGLVVLILIVFFVLILTLVKGKKEDKGEKDNSSSMTFQQEIPQDNQAQEPQMFTPQMQTPQVAPTPDIAIPNPMENLNTPSTSQTLDQPINQPVMQPQEVPMSPVEENVTQTPDMYSTNQLPNTDQLNQDLNTLNTIPASASIAEPASMPDQDQINNDMQNIMNALNTPNTTTMPQVDNSTTSDIPVVDLDNPTSTTPDMGMVSDMNQNMVDTNPVIPTVDTPVVDINNPMPVTPDMGNDMNQTVQPINTIDTTTPPTGV